jgi:hypothetical protein
MTAAFAADNYRVIRMYVSGSYTTWNGIDATNTNQRILVVIGSTRSLQVTYPADKLVHVSLGSGYIDIEVPNMSLPIPVVHHDKIAYCSNGDLGVTCVCGDQGGMKCNAAGADTVAPVYDYYYDVDN